MNEEEELLKEASGKVTNNIGMSMPTIAIGASGRG